MLPFLRDVDRLVAHAKRLRELVNEVAASGFAADKGYLDDEAITGQRDREAELVRVRADFAHRVQELVAAYPLQWQRATDAWRVSLGRICTADSATPARRAAEAALARFDDLVSIPPGPAAYEVVAFADLAVHVEAEGLSAIAMRALATSEE